MTHLLTPTSVGEVLDKISILQIKAQRIVDQKKNANVLKELNLLNQLCSQNNISYSIPLFHDLKAVNEELWEIEDKIRLKEKSQEFDSVFIQLARSVYVTNDKRAKLKSELNRYFNSDLVEEKSYEDYTHQ